MSVRRIHKTLIGPMGAAIEKPMTNPLSRKAISILCLVHLVEHVWLIHHNSIVCHFSFLSIRARPEALFIIGLLDIFSIMSIRLGKLMPQVSLTGGTLAGAGIQV